MAAQHADTNYALGSVLNHVLMHQTIIGEEALLQLAKVGERPDLIVGCTGGGSNFGGLAFPFLREKLAGRMAPTIRAVEPAACPSLTQGVYAYDFGDTAGMTPLMKMHTLGHDFVPDPIHAGGLRYHGMSPLISHLYEQGLIEAIAKPQRECFAAGVQFARTEGIVPAPEPTHAIAAAIEEALRCKEIRRGEGDPHGAVRARPPRPARLRRLPRRARWSTTNSMPQPSRRPSTTCPRCRSADRSGSSYIGRSVRYQAAGRAHPRRAELRPDQRGVACGTCSVPRAAAASQSTFHPCFIEGSPGASRSRPLADCR